MNIELIKKLGQGVQGTVYLVESDKKKYIYKLEKMQNSEMYERQVDFDSKIAQNFPDYFLTLKSYGIINFCNHKQPIPKWIIGKFRKKLEKKNCASKCFYLIYSPVLKRTLDSMFARVMNSSKLYLTMVYDILYALNILKINGFSHNDIHKGNIMYGKGRFYLIDYGIISHRSYKMNVDDKNFKKWGFCDIIMFIWECLIWNHAFEAALKQKVLVRNKSFMNSITKYDEYKQEWKQLVHLRGNQRMDIAVLIIALKYPEIYSVCLGLKETVHAVVPFPNLIYYIIKHINDKDFTLILKYVSRLRNSKK
jgi:serine/threonine protein kinase